MSAIPRTALRAAAVAAVALTLSAAPEAAQSKPPDCHWCAVWGN